jgi:hypothetical protein
VAEIRQTLAISMMAAAGARRTFVMDTLPDIGLKSE